MEESKNTKILELTQVFKTRLKFYREHRGLSQQKLAEKVELSTVYIAEMELGRRTPSFSTLALIAEALAIEPYQLLIVLDDNQKKLLSDFFKTILSNSNRLFDTITSDTFTLKDNKE